MSDGILLIYLARKRRTQAFRNRLSAEGRRRRQRHLPRISLLPPSASPWQQMYDSNNDTAMITVTGFDCNAFEALHDMFRPLFDMYSPWTKKDPGLNYRAVNTNQHRGSPRIISSSQCLGIVLAWYRFRGAEYILQGWFGFTGAHANVWIRFGRRMLINALCQNPLARVRMPTAAEVANLKQICKARHNSLHDVYAAADGLKIAFQSCHGMTEQSRFYNGWLHGHFITNMFVFSIDGRIIACCLNIPGSVHDSTVAHWSGIYDKLEAKFNETGGVCCVDSAYASNSSPYLLRSAQDVTGARDAEELVRLTEATSLRQASEWGMRGIQGAFPKLKDQIKYEEKGERRRLLQLVPLLYNYRLEAVGLNQIRNTYAKVWSKDYDYIK